MVAIDISHARHSPPRRVSPPGAENPPPSRPRPARKPPLRAGGPVVPLSVKGRYRTIKWVMLAVCLGIYGLLPFLRWARGPDEPSQAVLIDLEKGRLYLFALKLWPQELYLLTGALVLATLVLILANAVAGRVWCGFACPQTVWTDLFLAVERLVEGDRRERLRKREAGLSLRRIGEIGLKHAIWLAISAWTGTAFILYFDDAPTMLRSLAAGDASLLVWSWIVIIGLCTYALAGFAREVVCTAMCPWPRLQGAIWDREALTVNYRDHRGEPRASAKKAAELRAAGAPAGDCVDCLQCVQVCPIGIDIREGPNFACINCGLCVDACDGVMAKLDRPRGLIDYESWANIERGRRGEPRQLRLVRPKTLALAGAILALVAAMGVVLAMRDAGGLFVEHERTPIATLLADGRIRNAYTLRIQNKEPRDQRFALSIEGAEGLSLAVVGSHPVLVHGDSTAEIRVTVTGAPGPTRPVAFAARSVSGGPAFAAADAFMSPQ